MLPRNGLQLTFLEQPPKAKTVRLITRGVQPLEISTKRDRVKNAHGVASGAPQAIGDLRGYTDEGARGG